MPHAEERANYLHFSFNGEHILLRALPLDSFLHFLCGSILIIMLCLIERALTFAMARNWNPFPATRRSRWCSATWKASLYWAATLLRLAYMLVAMSYNLGLITVTATALAAGQLVIEYLEAAPNSSRELQESYGVDEPLLGSRSPQDSPYPPKPQRPRTKTRPDGIFIHPNESNVFRAEAIALEMSTTSDAELVKGNGYPARESWEHGGDKAQGILASSSRLKFPS